MKNVIRLYGIIILLAVLPNRIYAQHTGDTLWVWAESGLHLREAPNIQAYSMAVLPPGTAVIVQADTLRHDEITVTVEFRNTCVNKLNFRIKGSYIKVKASEKTGYVFDGYLSQLSLPANGFQTYVKYFTALYGQPVIKTERRPKSQGTTTRYLFSNDMYIQNWEDQSGRIQIINIMIHQLKLNEVFLMTQKFEGFYCMFDEVQLQAMGDGYTIYQFSGSTPYFCESIITITDTHNHIMIEINRDWE